MISFIICASLHAFPSMREWIKPKNVHSRSNSQTALLLFIKFTLPFASESCVSGGQSCGYWWAARYWARISRKRCVWVDQTPSRGFSRQNYSRVRRLVAKRARYLSREGRLGRKTSCLNTMESEHMQLRALGRLKEIKRTTISINTLQREEICVHGDQLTFL